MDKKIAGLLGAAAALTTITAANAAAPAQGNQPASVATYRDLLDPVANPVDALKADDARLGQSSQADATAGTQVAQGYYHHHHHHHHHHVVPRPLRRMFRHHHHHHHHH